MGNVVPKNIPMKEASVYNSYDLEHLKGIGINLFEKGAKKKVYNHLHKMLKGEPKRGEKSSKMPGPTAAPGQKIKQYDYRKQTSV